MATTQAQVDAAQAALTALETQLKAALAPTSHLSPGDPNTSLGLLTQVEAAKSNLFSLQNLMKAGV